MTDYFESARQYLREFKGEHYLAGQGILAGSGALMARAGKRAALIRSTFPGGEPHLQALRQAAAGAGVAILEEIEGARPNAPREDLLRMIERLHALDYDLLISFGGGSTIDAAKAADVLVRLGGEIDAYFGTGQVSRALDGRTGVLTPHIAFQTVASSAAHLTKYSNITDLATGQKKLIVDEAIVPAYAAFDYAITHSSPADLTMDGALDSMAHCLEVLYGAVSGPGYGRIAAIAEAGISLVVEHLPQVIAAPGDASGREALCLASDLGGYCIMLGGTNGGHLTSFSLVDILSHGRACAMLNPYYTVFFAPAIEGPLRLVGSIFERFGYLQGDLLRLSGRALGEAVAEAMFSFARRIGFPTSLNQIPGFTEAHILRALNAAKDPQLRMKLENMPVRMQAESIDETMGPILRASASGDLALIRSI